MYTSTRFLLLKLLLLGWVVYRLQSVSDLRPAKRLKGCNRFSDLRAVPREQAATNQVDARITHGRDVMQHIEELCAVTVAKHVRLVG